MNAVEVCLADSTQCIRLAMRNVAHNHHQDYPYLIGDYLGQAVQSLLLPSTCLPLTQYM